MKDVASLAGVALKTVSRVVNDEPGVTPAGDATSFIVGRARSESVPAATIV